MKRSPPLRQQASASLLTTALTLASLLPLHGCGGGGGGDGGGSSNGGSPPPTVTPPVVTPPVVTPPATTAAPTITAALVSQTVTAPQLVTFSADVKVDGPYALQWQRDGIDIPGATGASYTHVAQPAESGSRFVLRASNAGGSVSSAAATLTVLSGMDRGGSVSLLAGAIESAGYVDGTGAAARFIDVPNGLAVDPAGNVLVSERLLRKVSPTGVVQTVALPFSGRPYRLAVDGLGNIYTLRILGGAPLDPKGIYKIAPDGRTTALGMVTTSGFVADAAGNLLVADAEPNAIRRVSPSGEITTLAGGGSDGQIDGTGAAAHFRRIYSPVLDSAGNVYVADSSVRSDGSDSSIRKITPAGVVTTLLRVPASTPLGLMVVNRADELLFVDYYGDRVIRKLSADGVLSVVTNLTDIPDSADAPPASVPAEASGKTWFDPAGNLYVYDQRRIRRIDSRGNVTTIAGRAEPAGLPTYGRYQASDAAGNVYLTARDDSVTPSRWVLQKIAPDGRAVPLLQGLSSPAGIAVDAAGSVVYAIDQSFDCGGAPRPTTCAVVVKVVPGSQQSSVLAGGSTPRPSGSNGDGVGTAANFNSPAGLALDAAGNLFVGEEGAIRKITPDGTVSTVFKAPLRLSDVALDPAGGLFAAACKSAPVPNSGSTSNTLQVIKVEPSGAYTVLASGAGSGGPGAGAGTGIDGPPDVATFGTFDNGLYSCANNLGVDPAGRLFVTDTFNHTIRMIASGLVRTVIGQTGRQGITTGRLPATLSAPTKVSFDGAGNMYVLSPHAVVKVRFDE